jgi:hypothetical protein
MNKVEATMRNIPAALLLASILCAGSLRAGGVGAGDGEWEAYTAMLLRIEEASRTGTLEDMEKLGSEVQTRWAAKDPARCAHLTLALVNLVAVRDLKDQQTAQVARNLVLRTLERAEQLPPALEVALLRRLAEDLRQGRVPEGEDWSRQRTHDAPLWFHAWRRVNEPVQRAQRDNQAAAQQLARLFPGEAMAYLVEAYSKAPLNEGELRLYLGRWMPDVQEYVLARVQARLHAQPPTTAPSGRVDDSRQ